MNDIMAAMNLSAWRRITDRSNRLSTWLPYCVSVAIFIALVSYILSHGAGGDVEVCVWLFVVTHPVLTLPVLITYLRVRDLQNCLPNYAPAKYARAYRIWFASLLVGLLPGLLLAIGHFMVTLPGQPAELPIFLALVTTLMVFLMWARRLSRALIRQQGCHAADSMNGLTISAGSFTLSRHLNWLYPGAAAALTLLVMIPFSPIWYASTVVGVSMIVLTIGLAYVGVVLLVDALRRRHHFALQMAALCMSAYVAVVITYAHLIR